ncbi:hypothetical protein OHB54_46740 (plasmid) [Streptomyces sp. NBC_01007]|nr:hypothetical protein OHB54_46740 [Streptomyces sp. NBC_01007]
MGVELWVAVVAAVAAVATVTVVAFAAVRIATKVVDGTPGKDRAGILSAAAELVRAIRGRR